MGEIPRDLFAEVFLSQQDSLNLEAPIIKMKYRLKCAKSYQLV